jgi:hypothetical protein
MIENLTKKITSRKMKGVTPVVGVKKVALIAVQPRLRFLKKLVF